MNHIEQKQRCQLIACNRSAEMEFGNFHFCSTHHRVLTVGEFGERATPPWTRERALDALIVQDGLDLDVATKRVDDWFDGQPGNHQKENAE